MQYHRIYARIDIDAILHNLGECKRRIPEGTKVLAVIKADGYGHGAVELAHQLESEVDYFGVAVIEEAVELRRAGIKKPILILGYTSPSQDDLLINYDITQNIYTYDMVRFGISLYGLYPSEEVDKSSVDLIPAMELRTKIVNLKTVPAGCGVSYGHTFVTHRETRIATIPVGYADGYPRALSSKGRVIVNGQFAPIIGRVCMDQFMIDITDIEGELNIEDEVILMGSDNGCTISAEEIGDMSASFNYEFVCGVARRVPRIYFKDGKPYKEVSYILDKE